MRSVKGTTYYAREKFGEIVKGEIRGNAFMEFTDKGNMTEYFIEDKDVPQVGEIYDQSTYKYYNKGNKIEVIGYNSDGRLDYKSISKYNEKGNEIEAIGYNANGLLNWKSVFIYDEKGNKIDESYYSGNGKLSSKIILKYDNNGNKIENSKYNPDGSLY